MGYSREFVLEIIQSKVDAFVEDAETRTSIEELRGGFQYMKGFLGGALHFDVITWPEYDKLEDELSDAYMKASERIWMKGRR